MKVRSFLKVMVAVAFIASVASCKKDETVKPQIQNDEIQGGWDIAENREWVAG